MSTKRADRTAAKKVRDKWKAKIWYTIVAPETFASKEIGETPSETPEQLLGRVTETTLYDITGNVKKSYIKLFFKIDKIEGTKAITSFIGHDTLPDYTRRLVRRRKSRIDIIFPISTNDGYSMRIKLTLVSDKRINSSLKTAIRNRIKEILKDYSSKNTYSEFVKYMISDTIVADIENGIKTIYPIRKIEIRKSDLLKTPEQPAIAPENVAAEPNN
jgi:small subunit ribosomal protein S3Ae